MYQRIGNMPKACPYVMVQFSLSPIVVDVNYTGGEKMATNSGGGEFVALLYIVCNGCAIWR